MFLCRNYSFTQGPVKSICVFWGNCFLLLRSLKRKGKADLLSSSLDSLYASTRTAACDNNLISISSRREEAGGRDAAVKSQGTENLDAAGQRALSYTWVTNSNSEEGKKNPKTKKNKTHNRNRNKTQQPPPNHTPKPNRHNRKPPNQPKQRHELGLKSANCL